MGLDIYMQRYLQMATATRAKFENFLSKRFPETYRLCVKHPLTGKMPVYTVSLARKLNYAIDTFNRCCKG